MGEEAGTILLVDDDPDVLSALELILGDEGYRVLKADSAKKGLKLLEKDSPDLIVLDMKMPGISGAGFLREITGSDGRLRYPVLVLTAYANMSRLFENVEVDGFMLKPCEADNLLKEVERILSLRKAGMQAQGEEAARTKVLIVEDDDALNSDLVNAFSEAGFAVKSVKDGSDAVAEAIVWLPDVVAVKEAMPEINGEAVASTLANIPKTNGIRVIVYEKKRSMSLYREVLARRGEQPVVSIRNPAELVSAVRRVLV